MFVDCATEEWEYNQNDIIILRASRHSISCARHFNERRPTAIRIAASIFSTSKERDSFKLLFLRYSSRCSVARIVAADVLIITILSVHAQRNVVNNFIRASFPLSHYAKAVPVFLFSILCVYIFGSKRTKNKCENKNKKNTSTMMMESFFHISFISLTGDALFFFRRLFARITSTDYIIRKVLRR